MDRFVYLGMAGARDLTLAQARVTHNLANASVPGFRADLTRIRSLPVHGPGLPGRVFPQAAPAGADLSSGVLQATGRELDVALDGPGWIAVQAPDGGEAYTRAGDLRVNSAGLLTTGRGHPVLGENGPISVPAAESLEIAPDGTLSARLVGEGATGLVVLDRIRLVSAPDGALEKGLDGLFRPAGNTRPQPDAAVRLVPRSLESSNVDTVGALVELMSLARGFEVQVRIMKTAEENDAASLQLLRMG